MTPERINEILDQLNDYEARDWDAATEPHNIWQDVILNLDEYDEAATDQIDRGTNDRFIAGDTMFTYSMQDSHWFTEAP